MSEVQEAQNRFIRLVRDVYCELRQEAPELNPEPASPIAVALTLEGVEFTVSYDPAQSVERISVFCRFGKFPERIEVPVLYRLLEVNLFLALTQSAALGADPETHEVIYFFSGVLASITAQSLLGALMLSVAEAKRWRTDYFLENIERPMDKGTHAAQWVA